MLVSGKPTRSIWSLASGAGVGIIDQTRLPFEVVVDELRTWQDCARAIKTMQVRGAPLIGATAAYGLALAVRDDCSDAPLHEVAHALLATRPTAVNLRWALDRMMALLISVDPAKRLEAAWREAASICDEDVATNRAIGEHGARLLRELKPKGERLNLMTHCNAGWIATVDWGTALAPIYVLQGHGQEVHVWVSETRPRSQGARLTAWELGHQGVAHTVVVDNACGLLMMQGHVDAVVVGADRVTRRGDVANKVGTYLKALAARAHGVPFYVALPGSTLDGSIERGTQIEIETRSDDEVLTASDDIASIKLAAPGSLAHNPGFDITPAELVTAFITERGVCAANEAGLSRLFPEKFH